MDSNELVEQVDHARSVAAAIAQLGIEVRSLSVSRPGVPIDLNMEAQPWLDLVRSFSLDVTAPPIGNIYGDGFIAGHPVHAYSGLHEVDLLLNGPARPDMVERVLAVSGRAS